MTEITINKYIIKENKKNNKLKNYSRDYYLKNKDKNVEHPKKGVKVKKNVSIML